MKRELSEQAKAAKMIRQQLKAAFPHTTFRVTSDGYSMGDHVNIDWIDGPTTDQVDAMVGQYEYGHFDGMRDIYEYSNRRDDIPQSKFVFTTRDRSNEATSAIVQHLNQRWGWDLTITPRINSRGDHVYLDIGNDQPAHNGHRSHEIHRTFHKASLICPECKASTMFGDAFCPQCGANLDAAQTAIEINQWVTA